MGSKNRTWESVLEGYIVSEENSQGERDGFCPFHDDSSPSASYNYQKQVMRCHACAMGHDFRVVADHVQRGENLWHPNEGIYHPDPVDYAQARRNSKRAPIQAGEKELDLDYVMAAHYDLLENEDWDNEKRWLLETRGFTMNTLIEYRIGIELRYGNTERPGPTIYRYTIPIRKEVEDYESYEDYDSEEYVNVRFYSPLEGSESKVINFPDHGRPPRLYPIQRLRDSDEIVLCEGEWDALLTNQKGFTALTATGGAGTWLPEWNSKFAGKTVYIAYDNDETGRRGREKVARHLYPYADAVYLVDIPLAEEKADVGDLWVREGYNATAFQEVLDSATLYEPSALPQVPEPEPAEDLENYSVSEFYDHRSDDEFFLTGVVSYVDSQGPRRGIPKSVTMKCDRQRGSVCTQKCGFFGQYPETSVDWTLNPRKDWVAELVSEGTAKWKRNVGKEFNAYFGSAADDKPCQYIEWENLDKTWGQKVRVQDRPDREAKMSDSVESVDVYILNDNVELTIGNTYKFRGFHVQNSKAEVYMMATEFEQVEVDIDSFDVDAYFLNDVLPEFQCGPDQTPMAKAGELADRLSKTTGIDGRKDIHISMLLTMMSALEFERDGDIIQRGWLDILLYGESRTGKTAAARGLIEHTQLGTKASCESASRAGLIGGNDQSGGLTWGLFPRSDRRMLVMDEMSALTDGTKSLLAQLKTLRSEGLADINKQKAGRAQARVRTVWMSNPEDETTHGTGITHLRPLVKKTEDIARFDFALYLVSEDRGEPAGEEVEPLDGEVLRRMALWAWTRKAEHINLSPQVIQSTQDAADQLMDMLPSSERALFGMSDSYEKIQRIAVAFAIMTGSTRDGHNVDVEIKHVTAAYELLHWFYNRPSMGYFQKALQEQIKVQECRDNFYLVKYTIFMKYKRSIQELYQQGMSTYRVNSSVMSTYETLPGDDKPQKIIDHLVELGFVDFDRIQKVYVASVGLQQMWPEIQKDLWNIRS